MVVRHSHSEADETGTDDPSSSGLSGGNEAISLFVVCHRHAKRVFEFRTRYF